MMNNITANAFAVMADEYAIYEASKNTIQAGAAIRDIISKSWDFDSDLIRVIKENNLYRISNLEPLHVSEYSYAIVRNEKGGFNLHLVDEDNLNIMHAENVSESGIIDAMHVLASRYLLFVDGVVNHELQKYEIHADNDKFSDEVVFFAFEAYKDVLFSDEMQRIKRFDIRKDFQAVLDDIADSE